MTSDASRCFARSALLLLMQPLAGTELVADRVVVNKSERTLYLYRGDDVLREFEIALGLMPEGHKEREGDFRTPEGNYRLTNRLADSDYFMAIQVSYPNRSDIARARELGVSPGGAIMIHGQPNATEERSAGLLRQI